MEQCKICETPETQIRLFDGIHNDEMVKICEECARQEGIVMIKKPSTKQLKNAEKPYSVYERLARVSGVGVADKDKKKEEIKKIATLEGLRKGKKEEKAETEAEMKLVDNFHWKILNARRKKKLSIKQLSELLYESEEAIKMLESGKIPEESGKLIAKLEQYFQINLRVEKPLEEEINIDEISFKKDNLRNLTIGKLRKLQKSREKPKKVSAQEIVNETKKNSDLVGDDIELG